MGVWDGAEDKAEYEKVSPIWVLETVRIVTGIVLLENNMSLVLKILRELEGFLFKNL